MEWLNYHHLQYFWAVAHYGSVVRASEELKLAQPTISGQVRRLEEVLGVKLFDRVGRQLVLTSVGHTVFGYANEIFALGNDMVGALKGRASDRPLRLTVGVADVLPKVLVQKLLAPAFLIGKPLQLICRQDRAVEDFMGELVQNELDMVLADRPIGPGIKVHAHNHLLGQSGTTFLACRELAKKYRRGFPRSLHGAPCLLPSAHAAVRRVLDQWFETTSVKPSLLAEFDDGALMSAFGQEGLGIFPSPTVLERDFAKRYDLQVVGRVPEVVHHYYGVSVDQRLLHPGVQAIVSAARNEIFK